MPRRPPKPISAERGLQRRVARIEPLPLVYIFCEGKITEPEYIMSFFRSKCRSKRKIIPELIKGAGVPLTIVERCIEKMAHLAKAGRTDSIERRSCVWGVFDVDVHPNLDKAIALANEHNIPFSLSNPCIEIWGLMHLSVYERPSNRQEAQRALSDAMPPYHHDKNPIIPWVLCEDVVNTAIENSKKAIQRREKDGQVFPGLNPSTDFHKLLELLMPPDDDAEI